ncbi:MAG: type III pantothenate kinase [Candidatus Endobugula sp.]|jgi:type III pantothenate kinase
MFLEIDVGNTRIKWRLREQQRVIATYFSPTASMVNIELIFAQVDLSRVSAVYIASVVPRCNDPLLDWCKTSLKLTPIFAEVVRQHAGVLNGYGEVSQMGVDRWLALLAAWQRTGDVCLVVDAGSAVTLDLLLSDGVHRGGYIVPGLQLMNSALFQNTDRVKMSNVQFSVEFNAGTSTAEAVASGLPLMLLGLIERVCSEIEAIEAGRPTIIVTGGDGEYISAVLVSYGVRCVEFVPELVLDGLALAIESE